MRRCVSAGLLVAAVVGLAGCGGSSQPEAPPPVRADVQRLVRTGAPGVLLFVRHGDRGYGVAAGVSDTASKAPMHMEDTFRIGSITKSFVATVVLALAGEGKLSLDDPVSHYLPRLVPGGRRITIRQLLNHTSGLFNYTDDEAFLRPYLNGDLRYVWSPRRLIRLAVTHPPLFKPGALYSYSNTNYLLLGLIIERVSGSTVEEELQTRIIWPLHLDETRLPSNEADRPSDVHGYLKRGNNPPADVTRLSSSYGWSAGGMVSSGEDIADFYRGLLTTKLLSRRLLDEMEATTAKSPNYGLGLTRFSTGCGLAWGHNGGFPGYQVFARSSPNGDRQAVLLVNADWTALPSQAAKLLEPVIRRAYCA